MGLLGGSFNPLHNGHIHIAREAIKRLNLDAVWFLVSPQNPLKEKSENFEQRFLDAQKTLRSHHRLIATRLEEKFSTSRSFHTLKKLEIFFPTTHFIWIAGDDIAAEFDRWYRWQHVPLLVPFVFFERTEPVRRSKIFARFPSPNHVKRLRNIPRNPLASRDLRASQKHGIMKEVTKEI